jgi:hypothetical protein
VVSGDIQLMTSQSTILCVHQPFSNCSGLTLNWTVIMFRRLAELATSQDQGPTIITTHGDDLGIFALLLPQDPSHTLFAVVRTEAGGQFRIKRFDPINNQFSNLPLAFSKCFPPTPLSIQRVWQGSGDGGMEPCAPS